MFRGSWGVFVVFWVGSLSLAFVVRIIFVVFCVKVISGWVLMWVILWISSWVRFRLVFGKILAVIEV